MSFFDDECNPIDCALLALEEIGLNIATVQILKREWPVKLGRDEPIDSVEDVSPTPRIQEISLDHRAKEAGLEKRGDLLLKLVSKTKYPDKEKTHA